MVVFCAVNNAFLCNADMRWPQALTFGRAVSRQKFQFLAFATMKSRKAFSFAAFFISSG